jgi:hypothetical protein
MGFTPLGTSDVMTLHNQETKPTKAFRSPPPPFGTILNEAAAWVPGDPNGGGGSIVLKTTTKKKRL